MRRGSDDVAVAVRDIEKIQAQGLAAVLSSAASSALSSAPTTSRKRAERPSAWMCSPVYSRMRARYWCAMVRSPLTFEISVALNFSFQLTNGDAEQQRQDHQHRQKRDREQAEADGSALDARRVVLAA